MHARSQQHKKQQRGFTLIEMIFYIALLVLVVTASIAVLLSLSETFAQYRAEQQVTRSAATALERILFDIRDADTVTAATSTDPGYLTVTVNGESRAYTLNSGRVHLAIDGSDLGPLTDSDVTVDTLRFYDYASTTNFVRVELTLSAGSGDTVYTKTFNAGALLQGSYE